MASQRCVRAVLSSVCKSDPRRKTMRLGDGIRRKEMIPMYAQPSQAKPTRPDQPRIVARDLILCRNPACDETLYATNKGDV